MNISLNLSKIISDRKAKKKDLYTYLGISKQTLDDYLSEKTSMTVLTLEKTAKFFNVPIGYFFDDTSIRSISQKGGNGSAMSVHGDAISGRSDEYKNKYYELLEKYQNLMEKYANMLEEKR